MEKNLWRGKRVSDKSWIYGSLVELNDGSSIILQKSDIIRDGHHIHIDSDLSMYFDNDTITEYSKLDDRNGVNIFDGDIIEVVAIDDSIIEDVVIKKDGKWMLLGCGILFNNLLSIMCEIEVIGNIFDNPKQIVVGHRINMLI